jgi:hypothetical protein
MEKVFLLPDLPAFVSAGFFDKRRRSSHSDVMFPKVPLDPYLSRCSHSLGFNIRRSIDGFLKGFPAL